MLHSFPHTNDSLSQQIWERHVSPLLSELSNLAKEIRSYSPPTQLAIDEFLEECPDEGIQELRLTLADLKDQIGKIEGQLYEYAVDQLIRPTNADQTAAAKQRYNQVKKRLQASIDSMRFNAEHEKDEEVLKFIETIVIPTHTRPKNNVVNDLSDMREWLRARGHPVADRGRIAQQYQDIYYSQH